MEKVDKTIRLALSKQIKSKEAKPTLLCPDDEILTNYLADGLSSEQVGQLDEHMWDCQYCMMRLSDSYEAKALHDAGDRKSGLSFKKYIWLLIAGVSFGLSFVFSHYFMQFLVATLIFGLKWVAETRNAKTLIMVLDSWRRHSHDKDSEISNRLRERIDN